jgi:hypothetical protein
MQYKKFLNWAGILLLSAAILGFFGLGPTSNASALGDVMYFDNNQSLIHLVLALIALAATRFNYEPLHRYLTAALGVMAISVTAYSFYRVGAPSPNLFVANIETPWESLLYLGFGLWALWVVLMPPGPVFVKEDLTKK